MRGLGIASVFLGIWGGACGVHYGPAWTNDATTLTAMIFVIGGIFATVFSTLTDL